MENKVISLSTGQPVTQIKREDFQSWCHSRCENILVDTHNRKLTCRECGATIDSFDWAHKMSISESSLMHRIGSLRDELSTHNKSLENLKEEEKRVKARIRAAKDSLLKSAGI